MANTTSKAKKTTSTAAKSTTAKSAAAKKSAMTAAEVAAVEAAPVEAAAVVAEESAKQSYKIKQALDPNMYVTVKNGFNGSLVYKSKKTGERFVWSSFGDEQEMELSELKAARNSSKAFFTNNWFLFDDPEIVEWLGVGQYYKYALNTKAFDELFTKTPAEIKKTVAALTSGQKKSVAYRARQMIASGDIDSNKVIAALEKSLGTELIER